MFNTCVLNDLIYVNEFILLFHPFNVSLSIDILESIVNLGVWELD